MIVALLFAVAEPNCPSAKLPLTSWPEDYFDESLLRLGTPQGRLSRQVLKRRRVASRQHAQSVRSTEAPT